MVATFRFISAGHFRRCSESFSGYELAVVVCNRPLLRGVAREFRALKTDSDAFLEGTSRDRAHLVFLWSASLGSVRALVLGHQRAFLTGDSAHSNLHADRILMSADEVFQRSGGVQAG